MDKKKQSPANPVSPNDETIGMDADERVPSEVGAERVAPVAKSDSKPDADDLDATVTLESTVNIAPPDPVIDNQIDKTVAFGNSGSVDQTVADISSNKTVVYRGEGKPQPESDDQSTQSQLTQSTVGAFDSVNDATIAIKGSLTLSSPKIDATVNPRELSDEEAKLWNTVVGNGEDQASFGKNSANRSIDSPAIDRTFSDRHFERLRRSAIAEAHSDPNLPSDYRLNRKLGQGGMGDVYLARQRSLDRLLALKVIKPLDKKRREQLLKSGRLEKVEEERQMQFLAEAIITGDLDHPNIVPIHDVAVTDDGGLFYSMKRVDGTPWSDRLKEMSQPENLEVLLRVCDAIGFAHTRNVVHRDIKPENIMLGDFGVVMVMDWGLALPTTDYDKEKQTSIISTSGLGGTPSFMAPEMATGPLERIGPTADIYLLGATLFMIVTGHAPHHARNVSECLKVVRTNAIRAVDDKYKGELLDIAFKAMATKPSDRYQTVGEFQNAIRQYIAHDQSIGQTNRAFALLAHGKQSRSLADFHRASQGFEEAIKSWNGNERARQGLAETTIAHAEMAYELGEYESGIGLLDENDPDHSELLEKLIKARDERESRVGRLQLLRKLTAAMLAFILIGGSVAIFMIDRQRALANDSANHAKRQQGIAEEQTRVAEEEKKHAQEQREFATEQRKRAEAAAAEATIAAESEKLARQKEAIAREIAEKATIAANLSAKKERIAAEQAAEARDNEASARQDAERDRQLARYEEYVSKIGLAKARLETNDGKGARKILEELKSSPRSNGWEWRWLWQQANQSQSELQMDAPVIDLSLFRRGRRGVVATSSGVVSLVQFAVDGKIVDKYDVVTSRMQSKQPTAVAIAGDESSVAVGTQSGDIVILSSDGDRVLQAHAKTITDLQYTRDGRLVSSSLDRTVRVWNASTGRELTADRALWHWSPVRQIAVAGTGDTLTIAAATADESSGRVTYWVGRNGANKSSGFDAQKRGTFNQHPSPVSAISITSDGRYVASGDNDGNILIWNPANLAPIDDDGSIKQAIDAVDGDTKTKSSRADAKSPQENNQVPFVRLVDASLNTNPQFVSTGVAANLKNKNLPAHGDVIRSLQFSDDGKTLLTASDDYTLKLWGVDRRDLRTTMRGHGGWVVAADFLDSAGEETVSASNDASIRTWKPSSYHGEFVGQTVADQHAALDRNVVNRDAEAHDKEISSARFSRDGSMIVTASRDHTARILEIDPETLRFKKTVTLKSADDVLQEGTSYVAMSMEMDPAGKRLFIGGADATLRIWDIRTGVEVDRVRGTGLNNAFAVSNDGKLLLTGSSSPTAKAILWSIDPSGKNPAKRLQRFGGHEQALTAMAISPDGSQVFTGDRGGYGLLWDAKSGNPIGQPVEDVRGFRINDVEFSPDGRTLLIAADDEQLTQIDVQTRSRIGRLNHDGFVTQLAISSDGRSAVTLSELSTETSLTTKATHWNLDDGAHRVLSRVSGRLDSRGDENNRKRPRITSVRMDPTGAVITVCQANVKVSKASTGTVVEMFDGTGLRSGAGEAKVSHRFEIPRQLEVSEVVIPLDQHHLLTMNQNAGFEWDLKTGRLVKSFRSHAELTQACFSGDGKFVATASRSVKIWDVATGRAMGKLESPHLGPVRSVAFSPLPIGEMDHVIATGGDDGMTRLWKWDSAAQSITPLQTLGKSNIARIRRVAFSLDAKRLIAVGDRGHVAIWEMGKKEPRWTFDSPKVGDFVSAAFSSDGDCVATGSTDHQARVWMLGDDHDLGQPVVLNGHADVIRDVGVIGSGQTLRVLTASDDDSARVWDPRLGSLDADGEREQGREIVSLRRHSGDVTSVDASRNGQLLMTSGDDGKVILWPAEAPHIIESTNLFDSLDEL
ncbi:protein kinase domain-containing protein [Rubripirellula reticaptiva]|uniref:Serine/threonine-protein kinase PknD n=1 Tax=Rubripirellula reticaptiva TaxID=2528013 RepID=A0A5C6F6M4_9BACT|nr:protein kinase [Rubripirellula reticaptiva]TWU55736.1 Serine/threonine-protein kinase PknD [Rubripirellula reticaptiva]